jgi:hypothetical protein
MLLPVQIRLGRLAGLRGPSPGSVSPPVPPSGGGSPPVPPPVFPSGSASRGYIPASYREGPPARLQEAASAAWVQQVVERLNNMLQGRLNVTLIITLAANAGSTTVIDSRIGPFTHLNFSALTADAAAELAAGTMFVSEQKDGSAVITHANNAQADRTFNTIIVG